MAYIGNSVVGVEHPSTSALNATTGAFTGAVTAASTLGVTGAVTANAGVVVDNITIDGTEIDLSSGSLTMDVAGDITLDAGGGGILFKDDGTEIGRIFNSSSDLIIKSAISDQDFKLQGNDGGSTINALTLDMSAAGNATFSGSIFSGGNVVVPSGNGIDFSATGDGAGTDTSELLDDYEEGTWTPSYVDGTSSATYSTQSGIYTKIGNTVFFEFQLDGNSITGDGDHLKIGGLPYTANSANLGGAYIVYSGGVPNDIHVNGSVFQSQTRIGIYKYSNGGTVLGNTMALNGGWTWAGHYDV